jgi:signal recognition particle subunit SRP54
MGDVVGLIEKAQETADAEAVAQMEARLRRNEFTLDDFLVQIQQLKKMGSLDDILGMIPGLGINRAALKDAKIDEHAIDHTAAIIRSMSAKERAKPAIINGQRRERIAKGSGATVTEVNRLLKDFAQAKKMVQQMSKQKGRFRGGMPGLG